MSFAEFRWWIRPLGIIHIQRPLQHILALFPGGQRLVKKFLGGSCRLCGPQSQRVATAGGWTWRLGIARHSNNARCQGQEKKMLHGNLYAPSQAVVYSGSCLCTP